MKHRIFLTAIFCSILIAFTFVFNDELTDQLVLILDEQPTLIVQSGNQYTKDYDYKYVKLDNTYVPYGYQDLLNIIYSVLNNGWDTFTFYCPKEYEECIDDMVLISSDNSLLTSINNYVHPFNNFETIKSTFDRSGEITLSVKKIYSDTDMYAINNKIQSFKTSIADDLSNYDKIKAFHDYVINNSKYDIERTQIGKSAYNSNTAYGALIEGYAVCGGYSDAMAIYLADLGVKNYRISSSDHVWNAVYLNDEWSHLDLTWDDPYGDNGKDYLLYDYFLIKTDKLLELDKNSHNFNTAVYQEFK